MTPDIAAGPEKSPERSKAERGAHLPERDAAESSGRRNPLVNHFERAVLSVLIDLDNAKQSQRTATRDRLSSSLLGRVISRFVPAQFAGHHSVASIADRVRRALPDSPPLVSVLRVDPFEEEVRRALFRLADAGMVTEEVRTYGVHETALPAVYYSFKPTAYGKALAGRTAQPERLPS